RAADREKSAGARELQHAVVRLDEREQRLGAHGPADACEHALDEAEVDGAQDVLALGGEVEERAPVEVEAQAVRLELGVEAELAQVVVERGELVLGRGVRVAVARGPQHVDQAASRRARRPGRVGRAGCALPGVVVGRGLPQRRARQGRAHERVAEPAGRRAVAGRVLARDGLVEDARTPARRAHLGGAAHEPGVREALEVLARRARAQPRLAGQLGDRHGAALLEGVQQRQPARRRERAVRGRRVLGHDLIVPARCPGGSVVRGRAARSGPKVPRSGAVRPPRGARRASRAGRATRRRTRAAGRGPRRRPRRPTGPRRSRRPSRAARRPRRPRPRPRRSCTARGRGRARARPRPARAPGRCRPPPAPRAAHPAPGSRPARRHRPARPTSRPGRTTGPGAGARRRSAGPARRGARAAALPRRTGPSAADRTRTRPTRRRAAGGGGAAEWAHRGRAARWGSSRGHAARPAGPSPRPPEKRAGRGAAAAYAGPPMSRIGESVAPRRRGSGFRWLLASSWTSNVGDGIALAAGPLLVASQTDSAFLVALAALLQRLPWLLLGLWAGAIADRVDRRAVVMVANALRALVVVALCVLLGTGHVSIGAVLA